MLSFLSLTLALALGIIPLVSAGGAATEWLTATVSIDPFAKPTVTYLSCLNADQCYCGTVYGYTVPDVCQTSAPASITSIFEHGGGFNNSAELTGAVFYSDTVWIANMGDDIPGLAGTKVEGGKSIPVPAGLGITSATGTTTGVAKASSGSPSSTSSAASSSGTAASSTNAAASVMSAGTALSGLVIAGIAAGALLL
jgi:hypothetical protein